MLGEFGLSLIAALFGRDGEEPRSATGESVTVGGFDDEASSGHGGEAFVESGGANAAGCAHFGERPGLVAVGEGCGDALIDGSWFDTMLGLVFELDWLEGECVVALDQFKRDAWRGGGGTMLDAQDDTIVTVPPEIEIGITPGMELRRSAQGLPGTDGACALFGMVDECRFQKTIAVAIGRYQRIAEVF